MKLALLAWLTAHQDGINISGYRVREHTGQSLDRLIRDMNRIVFQWIDGII